MSTRLLLEFFGNGAAGLLVPLSAAISFTATLTGAVRVIRERRPIAWGVGFPLVALYLLFFWHEQLPHEAFEVNHSDASRVIRSHKWISYEPNLLEIRGGPLDVKRVRQELAAVRAAGFTGIVTYSMRDDLARVPAIASSVGLAVIAGVWDPNDRNEVANAIAAKEYVAAYAVGHIGLHQARYTFDEVTRAMRFIRFRTARPVSTTEKVDRYENDPRILGVGDWIFPDAHFAGRSEGADGDIVFDANLGRDVNFILQSARLVADWDRGDERGREILLKTVGYPHSGVPGASLELQRRFFVMLLEGRRDSRSHLPARVSFAIHTAYDTSWKRGWPYYPWDDFVGLFDDQRRPRPAVAVVVERM